MKCSVRIEALGNICWVLCCGACRPGNIRKFCRRWRKRWGYHAARSAGKPIEASVEQLQQLQERRWDKVGILVIYIDGQRFGAHLVLSAVGVDVEGRKHI